MNTLATSIRRKEPLFSRSIPDQPAYSAWNRRRRFHPHRLAPVLCPRRSVEYVLSARPMPGISRLCWKYGCSSKHCIFWGVVSVYALGEYAGDGLMLGTGAQKYWDGRAWFYFSVLVMDGFVVEGRPHLSMYSRATDGDHEEQCSW